jgi:fibronectin type 3 domain-containing protein
MRSVRRRLATRVPVFVLALLALALIIGTGRAGATDPVCQTSGPVDGSYAVTVCVSDPADGATVTGARPVTATVSVTGTSPGVQRMVFYLAGNYLLTDFQAPYTFSLHSERFVDGSKTLEVEALMRDGFTSQRASVSLTFQNGVTSPPPQQTGFSPTSGTAPGPGEPFIVAATGDGAGGEQNGGNVTSLIASWNPNLFLYLGDVYEKGSQVEFDNWYDPNGSFGNLRAITNPTIGNHEYENGQASGYFDYWKSPPHYYSFDAAGWHVISLDSTSEFGQTDPGSPQYEWLEDDLAASTAACKVAYFHHPLYNVGPEGSTPRMSSIWSLLASHGVSLVLAAHDHDYQRWVRLDGDGNPSQSGIVQFVAGGGGHGIQHFVRTDSRLATGFDTAPAAFGALRLELNSQGAAFQYVNTAGTALDSGSVQCNGTPGDTTAPSAAGNLTASAQDAHDVVLNWSKASDNVGVTGFDIYRDGSLLATVGPVTSYKDLTVASEITYSYQVRARDAAGNVSGLSNTATVTIPPGETGVFVDGFETGNLSKWTSVTGLTVQQQQVFSGSWAARGTSTGAATWAYKTLPSTQTSLYYRIRFKVVSLGSTVNLMKFRTGSGTSLLGYYLTSSGKLSYRNDVAGVSTSSTTTVSTGSWHTLQAHAFLNGNASQTETWLDDVKISALSKTESLGTTPIGRVQLGENSTGRAYDIAYDTVLVDTSFIETDTSPPSTPGGVTVTPGSPTEISVSWDASTDNVGVTGYTVYRDGIFLAGVPASTRSYTDTGLDPSSTHAYTVDAFDGAANHSPASDPVSASTPPDTTNPSVPSGLAVTGLSASEVDLSWDASTDDVGVAGYTIYRDGSPLGTVEGGVTSFIDATVVDSTTYSYTVDAFDAAENHSARSDPATATTPGPTDATPPSTPTGLIATAISSTRIDLSWDAATDDVGVTGYTVYRDGSPLTTVEGGVTSFIDATVADSTTYRYTVDAFDAAGNHSAQSDPATATTPADTSAPTKPSGLTATAVGPHTIDLSWSASNDDVGVTGYTVYRDGSQIAIVGGSTLGYSDTTASPSTTYSYTVDAFDAAGNHSARSDPASATTPAGLFADGFETGNLSNWTSVTGLTVQQQHVFSGSWAARGTSTGAATWAYKTLSSTQTSLYYRIRFKVVSLGSTVNVMKFRTGTGSSLLGVYLSSTGKLAYRNDVAGVSTSSTTTVSTGTWHSLQVHVVINGANGQTETWLDGVKINALSKTESLGTTPIGRIQLGENSTGRSYDVAFDTVAADTNLIS